MDEVGSEGMTLQSLDHHHHQTNNSQINPIDKLYLMQNSYFSSEH